MDLQSEACGCLTCRCRACRALQSCRDGRIRQTGPREDLQAFRSLSTTRRQSRQNLSPDGSKSSSASPVIRASSTGPGVQSTVGGVGPLLRERQHSAKYSGSEPWPAEARSRRNPGSGEGASSGERRKPRPRGARTRVPRGASAQECRPNMLGRPSCRGGFLHRQRRVDAITAHSGSSR